MKLDLFFMKILFNTFFILFIVVILFWLVFWLYSHKTYNLEYGISFNQNHATSLGLNWKTVYIDLLEELNPRYIRIAAMWSQIEEKQGIYNFSDIDWMMNMATKYGTKVLLVVGQKAPRWPECHVPAWLAEIDTVDARKEALLTYVRETVLRYKKNPSLELWQVENEAFIRFAFGDCSQFDQDAVLEEVALVRSLDPDRKIVMTDSGELSSWRRPSKIGDIFGTTMYRIVRTPRGHIFSYDWLPAGFYRIKAKLWGIDYKNFFVAELQAEPWFTDSSPLDTSVDDMEETMNPDRLQKHFEYASSVGASRVYLWGVEWWYFMKEKRADSRYWDIAQEYISSLKN